MPRLDDTQKSKVAHNGSFAAFFEGSSAPSLFGDLGHHLNHAQRVIRRVTQAQAGRMTITNLMVDPEYRRQGIGQALLVQRLERMTERGFPFAMAQVLETNTASLQNLRKQNFEVFN